MKIEFATYAFLLFGSVYGAFSHLWAIWRGTKCYILNDGSRLCVNNTPFWDNFYIVFYSLLTVLLSMWYYPIGKNNVFVIFAMIVILSVYSFVYL